MTRRTGVRAEGACHTTKRLFSDLKDNPVLAVLAVIVAGVGTLNGFTALLDLPPFWTDAVISVVLAAILISWIVATVRGSKPRVAAGLMAPPPKRRGIAAILLSTLIGAALLAILVRNVAMPVAHLAHPRWTVCGTFVNACGTTGCVHFHDARGREVSPCTAFADATGYVRLEQPSWTTYRPRTAVLECNASSRPIELEPSLFQPDCRGVVR